MTWPVDPARFTAFLGVTTTLSLAPGPAVLFCIAAGARGGPGAVAGGVAGITLAGLVWFAAAALGLGALMTAAPWVFRPLSFVGLAYLLWLGGSAIGKGLRRPPAGPATSPAPLLPVRDGLRDVGRGFVVQITNPKTLLYFSAVLPPFLDARRPLAGQLAAIGGGRAGHRRDGARPLRAGRSGPGRPAAGARGGPAVLAVQWAPAPGRGRADRPSAVTLPT